MTRFQTNYYILEMSTPIKYYKTFTFIRDKKITRKKIKTAMNCHYFFLNLTNVHAFLYIFYNLIIIR